MSAPNPSHDGPNKLENYPITLFAIGMGMMGLTLALHAAETSYGAGHGISTVMLVVSIAMLAAIAGGYTAKVILLSLEGSNAESGFQMGCRQGQARFCLSSPDERLPCRVYQIDNAR